MNIEEMKTKLINNELEKGIFASKNDKGEDLNIVIGTDCVSITTFQKNGWIRQNIYSYDGKNWIEEELYDGRCDVYE